MTSTRRTRRGPVPASPPGRRHHRPQPARRGAAAAEAEKGEFAYQVMQAGQPHRRAPLTRQVLIALVTVILDGLACYLTALALGGSLDATLAWTGLFLGVLVGGQAALGFCRDRGDRAGRLPSGPAERGHSAQGR